MPTYQYACTDPACDHRFEQFQSFTDPALTDCPVCSNRLRKVYGSVGVVFKGTGFYRNDSRAETNGAKKRGDAESGRSGDSKSDSSATAANSSDGSAAGKDKSTKENSASAQPSDSSTTSSSSKSATSSTAKAPAA